MTSTLLFPEMTVIYHGASGPVAFYGERCEVVGIIPSLTQTRDGDVYIGEFGVYRNGENEVFTCPQSWTHAS